jgi:hypothetical protein
MQRMRSSVVTLREEILVTSRSSTEEVREAVETSRWPAVKETHSPEWTLRKMFIVFASIDRCLIRTINVQLIGTPRAARPRAT